MRKRFKSRKKIRINYLFYIVFIVIIILFFKYFISKIKLLNSNEKILTNLLDEINYNSVSKISNYISDDIFNSPINLLQSKLKYNQVSKIQFAYVKVDKPLVYIYNSHQNESYSQKYLEEYNITPNVLMASRMLSEKLNNLSIKTIVEENNILEYMNNNNLDHSESYIASRYFLENIMNKYSSIELFIDLHRDAISYNTSYVNINGKDCAKILFVVGLENKNYQENLNVVESINNIINQKYPNLSRGIIKKQGYGVNGIYNQDLNSNVILIEIGGYENNIDEVNNTLDFISIAIKEYLNEKKE